MPTDTQFATDWLEERYRFDVAARNPKVEAACLQYFAQYDSISIIDIGAGTGANFIYLSEKFPQSQEWALVELNPDLLKQAGERLKTWAFAKGYTVQENKEALSFQRGEQRIQVRLIHGSFLELLQLVPINRYQLVTASAVFDLLSEQMLQNLIQTLHQNRLALLTTLNYESMSYLPVEQDDEQWIDLYEAHMQREQGFGRALGPRCSDLLESTYARLSTAQLIRAPSRWQIEPTDTFMHNHMLQFLEKSLLEMTGNGHSGRGLDEWLERKKEQLQAQQLRLSVAHSDLFTSPVYEG